MQVPRFLFLLVVALAAACDRTPTGPSVTGLTITAPSSPLLSRQMFQLTVETVRSNGTRTDVSNEAIWNSDNPAIASVSAGGLLTVVRHGSATVTAIHGERTARTFVRVLANFAGVWQSDYGVTSCDSSGVFQAMGACDFSSTRGVVPVTLAFTHDYAGDLDQVMGLLYFGLNETAFTGRIRSDGHLVGSSSGSWRFGSATIVTTLDDIDLAFTPEGDQLAGGFVVEQTAAGVPDSAHVGGALGIASRVARKDAVTVAGTWSGASAPPRILCDNASDVGCGLSAVARWRSDSALARSIAFAMLRGRGGSAGEDERAFWGHP